MGFIAPKHYGGVSLSYSVCNEYEYDYEYENQDKYDCTNGTTYLFGTITPSNESLPIDNNNYEVYESLYSGNDQNIYDAANWTNIELYVSQIAVGHGG